LGAQAGCEGVRCDVDRRYFNFNSDVSLAHRREQREGTDASRLVHIRHKWELDDCVQLGLFRDQRIPSTSPLRAEKRWRLIF